MSNNSSYHNLEFFNGFTGSELNHGKYCKCFHWQKTAWSKMENLCGSYKTYDVIYLSIKPWIYHQIHSYCNYCCPPMHCNLSKNLPSPQKLLIIWPDEICVIKIQRRGWCQLPLDQCMWTNISKKKQSMLQWIWLN